MARGLHHPRHLSLCFYGDRVQPPCSPPVLACRRRTARRTAPACTSCRCVGGVPSPVQIKHVGDRCTSHAVQCSACRASGARCASHQSASPPFPVAVLFLCPSRAASVSYVRGAAGRGARPGAARGLPGADDRDPRDSQGLVGGRAVGRAIRAAEQVLLLVRCIMCSHEEAMLSRES